MYTETDDEMQEETCGVANRQRHLKTYSKSTGDIARCYCATYRKLFGAIGCVRLATVLRHVGYCWLKFENVQIWANNTQHVAACCNRVAKRMQHAAPNNVAIYMLFLACCDRLAGTLEERRKGKAWLKHTGLRMVRPQRKTSKLFFEPR